MLSYILEKASGKKYEMVLKENIFYPLNMINSGYEKAGLIIKNRASGYNKIDNERVNALYYYMSFTAGAGALYSTVEDLYSWYQGIYSGKILSKESLTELSTPSIETGQHASQGYGLGIGKLNNHTILTHSGGTDGCSTDFRIYDDKLFVIVLSNYENSPVSHISQGLAAIILGEKFELSKTSN